VREELRAVPLFAELTDADLDCLEEGASVMTLAPGEALFTEGDQGDEAYVITDGEIEIVKITGEREVLLARRLPGEVIGEMALLDSAPRMASGRAAAETTLIAIPKSQMDQLLATSATAARGLFFILLERVRQTEASLRQSERMVQLGTLTAGLAHELNNPAAAIARAAGLLSPELDAFGRAIAKLGAIELTDEQSAQVEEWLTEVSQPGPVMGALERSEREAELDAALTAAGCAEPWAMAPPLALAGWNAAKVEDVHERFDQHAPIILDAISMTYNVSELLREINEGAGRMSEIVGALKSYTHLDQAPLQEVDVRKGLQDTLLILKTKLKEIDVELEFDEVPEIMAYGSELNQVWTNLIDNAADAVASTGRDDGTITLRTGTENGFVVVEVEDNGSGIAPDDVTRIFDAFFTTKPPGSGTGLGLDISYSIVVHKHRGDIKVDSEPGRTTFRVELPVSGPDDGAGSGENG
jgi:signal transduction histidine kinase